MRWVRESLPLARGAKHSGRNVHPEVDAKGTCRTTRGQLKERLPSAHQHHAGGGTPLPAADSGQEHMKILIADDEPAVLDLNCRLMRLAGFEVVPANDGDEAWNAFRSAPFPLVLTDLEMPCMDGFELIHRIRNSPGGKQTQIVVFSGSGRDPAILEALRHTVFEYLTKPDACPRLVETVRRASSAWQQIAAKSDCPALA